jgi:hypothetical protein
MTFSFFKLTYPTKVFFASIPLNLGLNPFTFWFKLLETAPRTDARLSSVFFGSAVVLSLQVEFSVVWLHSV